MYSATVLLTINSLVPMNGVWGQSPSIQATIGVPKDISPGPEPFPIFSTRTAGSGQSIIITIPTGYTGRVQLVYQLPDPAYVLLGVAFQGPQGDAGQMEFRDIELVRDSYGSQLTVTDSCDPDFDGEDYAYVILVQEISSGNIGLIDPDVETEEEQP
jgi:hypothetical protein